MRRRTGVRAALYARVSTDDKGQDVGLQLDDLRALARRKGWETTEFVDEGESGSKESRPRLDALLAEVRRGRFDVVAVWRFDRWARTTRQLVETLDEFRERGVEFVSVMEAIDTTVPIGRVLFVVIAAMAELERDVLVERVQAGMDRARARGVHCGRPSRTLPIGDGDLEDAARVAGGWNALARTLGVPASTLRHRAESVSRDRCT